jgi:hypothetical protein
MHTLGRGRRRATFAFPVIHGCTSVSAALFPKPCRPLVNVHGHTIGAAR